VGLLAILVVVLLAFRLPVMESLQLIAEGAGGDKFGWSRTAVKSTPLLLTGLGMVVAWRSGMYNIGGEGQFVIGALLGCAMARWQGWNALPGWTGTACILVASVVGGAVWAWFAGWLFVKRGVDVVISTILLNFVALQFLGWAVTGPLQEAKRALPLTDMLPDRLMLPRFDRQMELHLGVAIAVLAAIVVQIFLFATRAGFKVRLVGDNPSAARSNRIDASRMRIQAMLVSGGLCGLAGGIEYTGLAGQLGTGFALGWGFLGIPVALLGLLHPLLLIPSAAFFGALFSGSENLGRFTQAGPTLIYVVQATAVLAVVAMRAMADRRPVATEAD
jgi:simple sugar transport system permease protein